VVFGVVAILGLVMVWSGPTLAEQSQELRTKLPEAVVKLEQWMAKEQPMLLDLVAPADTVPAADTGGRLLGSLAKYSSPITDFAFGVLQSTLVVFAAVILVLFLAVYIAIDPGLYRHGVLLLVPLERRERMGDLLTALANALRIWFGTQLIAMLVIGLVTTTALAIIGVRAAIPLGLIAGIFEFIPNIGPTLSAIPAILVGFADSPQMALSVVALYWGIQFLENNLLIPYLMKEQLDLPPALTLVTQVVMAYVFGFLGLFVAIPMLAVAVVAVRMLWVDEDLPPFPTIEMAVARRKTEALPRIDTEIP
jgi:predicted PurR-regulated permease PerM